MSSLEETPRSSGIAGREPELVDSVQVSRVGDRDAQRPVLERVRDRDDALQHVQRNLLGSLLVDAREREVDERDLVADCERAGDPFRRRNALVDDRLGERALAGTTAHECELVRRDEARRLQQVDDELSGRVDRHARGKRRRAGVGGLLAGRADGAQIRWTFGVHIPRSSYRQRQPVA